jgi:LmbE family N-acetylglucosaminyl deacetylase
MLKSLVTRWPRLLALLAVVLVTISGGLYAVQEDLIGRVQLELADVADLSAYGPNDRVLVLAPHPDDEVLCTGGLIQSAVDAGAAIEVVYLTLGDSNLVSFQTYQRLPVVTPRQVRTMGEVRRKEALASLELLGVPAHQVHFLGYPDGGTLRIWQMHWQNAQPLRGRFTRAVRVPYGETLSPGAEYRGENILTGLKDVIVAFAPTVIFLSHPDDTNPDHQALWLFTHAALAELGPQYDSVPLWSSLVHYGTWPQPSGYLVHQHLLPPQHLVGPGMEWVKLALTEQQVKTKMAALSEHSSQLSFRREYLESFIRQNELFARVPTAGLAVPPSGEVSFATITASPRVSVLSAVTPALHLDMIEVGIDDQDLLVKLQTPRPLGPRESLTLSMFYQKEAGNFAGASKLAITVGQNGLAAARDGTRDVREHVRLTRVGNTFVIRADLAALGQPEYLFLQVQLRALTLTLDQTGWRILDLRGGSEPADHLAVMIADAGPPLVEEIVGQSDSTPVPAERRYRGSSHCSRHRVVRRAGRKVCGRPPVVAGPHVRSLHSTRTSAHLAGDWGRGRCRIHSRHAGHRRFHPPRARDRSSARSCARPAERVRLRTEDLVICQSGTDFRPVARTGKGRPPPLSRSPAHES